MTLRTPCCISGCRRTFKPTDFQGYSEVMCSKHYRSDRELLARYKVVKR